MNINAISAAAPKFQTPKAVRNVNFTGLEKTAQNLGSTAGEAAANAAGKLGITEQITKILSFVLEGVKNLGQKILRGIKKFVFGPHDINIGKNNKIIYTTNGKGFSTEEFDSAFEAFGAGSRPNVVIKQTTGKGGLGMSHISQTLASGEKFSITQIGGKTYINGKLYTPGDKLPEGIIFKDGAFCVDKGNGKKITIIQTTEEV